MLPESRKLISFSIASVQYGDKDFFVNDVFSDSLTFHTDLLTEIGEHWRAKITDEIKKCDESAAALRFLAKDIELAAGSAEDTVLKRAVVERAREQYYYEIDLPFRNWLERIDPSRRNRRFANGTKQQNESHCASVKSLLNRRARRQLSDAQ